MVRGPMSGEDWQGQPCAACRLLPGAATVAQGVTVGEDGESGASPFHGPGGVPSPTVPPSQNTPDPRREWRGGVAARFRSPGRSATPSPEALGVPSSPHGRDPRASPPSDQPPPRQAWSTPDEKGVT
jgi:hypothetical protein